MRRFKFSPPPTLGPGKVDPDNDRVKRFIGGLKNLAAKFEGRLNVEFEDSAILVSVKSDKVFAGVTEFLRSRGIEPVEVDILDEFFPTAAEKVR